MANSKSIAGLIGPTLIAVTVSESEFMNPHLYDHQIAPVVYLSGALFFVAGLSIVRVHNLWILGWPLLVTLMGWLAVIIGLVRLFAPRLYMQGAAKSSTVILALELVLLAVGIILTFKAYSRKDNQAGNAV